MKRSRFTKTQIIKILKEAEAGVAVEELSRQYGFSRSEFYKWKAKYGGMDAPALKRVRMLSSNASIAHIVKPFSMPFCFIRSRRSKRLQKIGWRKITKSGHMRL